MSDLQKNNEKAMSDGTAEAIHAETPEEELKNKSSFKNFFIGYIGLLFADLMTGYIMYSDGTLIPTYLTEFSALNTYALLGTCNSLIQAIAPPLVANSGEIFGFKRIYFFSLFLFILGCVLNGLSTNWNMFVAATSIRTLGTQGLNISGAILIATGLSLRKRGLWSSFQNIVYIITALTGPLIASALVKQGKWRVVYYMFIPIGVILVAPLMLKMKVPQRIAQDWRIKLSQIDFIGFILVVAATILISLPTVWGGTRYAWNSAPIIAFFTVGILLFIAFGVYILKLVKLEKPIIQTKLFRKSSMNWAIAATILQNAGVFGWMMYLSPYAGLVMNMSGAEIGYISTPYVVCSAFSGILEGLLLTKFGNYKPFLIISPLITLSGLAVTFAFSETTKSLMFVATGIVGLGVGSQYLSLVLSTQACHTHTDTAQAVMLLSFVAGLFGAFFTSITGAVFNTVHTANLEKYFPPGTPAATLALAKIAAARSSVPDPALLEILILAWSDTSKTMGIYCISLVAASYVLSWFIKPYKLTEKLGDAPERIPIKGIRGFLGMEEKDSQDKL